MVLVPSAPEPTGKIPPQDWITSASTRTVVAALQARGTEVRFVGGCVRDAVAKRPVGDVDIATPDPPETVLELLAEAGVQAVPTGIEHGTVSAFLDDDKFEITTLRRDLETDGRHARVAFTDDWVEDAARRDFTINTLSATPDGDVYDPYDGIPDLAHGVVRFIGRAEQRIDEDVLRILRFFRFHGAYGRPPPDRDALAACRAKAGRLTELSGERLRDEFKRILLVPDPAEIAVLMRGEKVFDVILPEVDDINRLRMLNWLETRAVVIDSVGPQPIRRLAALIDVDAAGAAIVAERFRLSNAERDRLVTACSPPIEIDPDMGEAAEMRALRKLGPDTVRDLVLLAWAGELSLTPRLPSERTKGWIAMLESAEEWVAPTFPLNGADVTALGVAEGPRVGALLTRVEDWWENGRYRATRQQCLDRLLKAVEEEK